MPVLDLYTTSTWKFEVFPLVSIRLASGGNKRGKSNALFQNMSLLTEYVERTKVFFKALQLETIIAIILSVTAFIL